MHRTRDPVSRCSRIAAFCESCQRHTLLGSSSYRARRRAVTSSKITRPWLKLEAQHTTSRLGPCSGPSGSRTAQATAARSALFPLPRPTVRAASPLCESVARINRRSHGRSRNGSPSPSPPTSVRPSMYRISALVIWSTVTTTPVLPPLTPSGRCHRAPSHFHSRSPPSIAGNWEWKRYSAPDRPFSPLPILSARRPAPSE